MSKEKQCAIYRIKTNEAKPVFTGTEKEVRSKWEKEYSGRPKLFDFFVADVNNEKAKKLGIKQRKITRKNFEEIYNERLKYEEPEKKELCTVNGKIYYYYSYRFVIRYKDTGGPRYIANGYNDIIFEWNEFYADRPYAGDYCVFLDDRDLEVTVTKDGYVESLDGSYV